jgi:hypothetical protein
MSVTRLVCTLRQLHVYQPKPTMRLRRYQRLRTGLPLEAFQAARGDSSRVVELTSRTEGDIRASVCPQNLRGA